VDEYDGRQVVGIDLHRRRSVIVRMTPDGQQLGPPVRIDNDPLELAVRAASWGECPQVVLEACYGWYWAADVLTDAGSAGMPTQEMSRLGHGAAAQEHENCQDADVDAAALRRIARR